ncbi:HTTM domain-containing protein [Antrihabitans sp. NCIMB 15449]|uniref:HTTM domain-containing protein n=1 Tax=Antrihabitans spumae TaxID=3373370 RepID=A0ABW7JHI8_9NOCA
MTTTTKSRFSWVSAGVEAWRKFWFEPQSAATLGFIRIAYGVLAIAWTVSLLPDLHVLFGESGVQPKAAPGDYQWSVLNIWSGDIAVWAVWGTLMVGSIALTLGWHSRLAALLVFVCMVSFQRRDIYVFNSGDVLVRMEALMLALAPCGAALSLDRRRTAGSFWSAQLRAPWVIRLMQVQLSLIYLVTVHGKVAGTTWNDGTAVAYALQLRDLQNFAAPEWLWTSPFFMNVATWGTLLVELALGVFVWNKRLRPYVLIAGVVMHLMILTSLAVAFFSFAMFILYLSFVSPETAMRWAENLSGRALRDRSRKVVDVLGREGKAAAEPVAAVEPSSTDEADEPARSRHRRELAEAESARLQEKSSRRSRRRAKAADPEPVDYYADAPEAFTPPEAIEPNPPGQRRFDAFSRD